MAWGGPRSDMNLGNLRSANVVQAGDRTRVVLNLKAPSTYKADIQGKSLVITLDSSSSASASPAGAGAGVRGKPQP